MVEILIPSGLFLVAVLFEILHLRRVGKVGALVFRESGLPFAVVFAAILRALACAAVGWALWVLMNAAPKVYRSGEVSEKEYRHVIMLVDVSPSMLLDDAGPERDQRRLERAAVVMESFFKRVPMNEIRMSLIAFYTGAKPIVEDTRDIEVVRSMLTYYDYYTAFEAGETDLFAGLEAAAKLARDWRPNSTAVVLLSDGDTVPSKGMPRMPQSVSTVFVIGLGDPRAGKFIAGRQSRQDTATLRKVAQRLGGAFHNGNEKHIGSGLLEEFTEATAYEKDGDWTKREWGLLALALGAATLALLPMLLGVVVKR